MIISKVTAVGAKGDGGAVKELAKLIAMFDNNGKARVFGVRDTETGNHPN